MIGLEDKVTLELQMGTLATLIAGLFCTYSVVDPMAVPTSLYIEIAEKIAPFLKDWDYSKVSFEEWVEHFLMIAPREMFSESELEEFKDNEIFFERKCGNAILVVTAKVVK